jgi:hypothetical protein
MCALEKAAAFDRIFLHHPRIASHRTGFRFCGMVLEPI